MKYIFIFILIVSYLFISPFLIHVYAQYPTPTPYSGPYGLPPAGAFTAASCQVISGWTCDRDNWAAPLTVDIYKDGPYGGGGIYVGSDLASENTSPVSFCGGNTNHGFSFTVPNSLKDAQPHTIYIYPHDWPLGNISSPLTNSPRTITCSFLVSGTFFNDLNRNGSYEPGLGETLVSGGTVSTSPAYSVTYPGAGQYQVNNLPAGTVNIYGTPPSGYIPYYPNNNGNSPFYTVTVGNACSTDSAHGSTCTATGNITGLRFALRQIFTIGGIIYIDSNRNGTYESGSGEIAYASGTQILLNGGNAKTSGAGGEYQYTGQYAGSYTVSATVPSGYVATSPSPASTNVSVGPSQGNINFGIVPQYTISGTVLIDYEHNGSGDAAYPSGASITLTGTETHTGNTINLSTTTNGSGQYTFSSVYEGSYTVTISSIAGYEISTTNYPLTVGPNTTQNFIIVPLYQISGVIFDDRNKDGSINGTEPNMSGNYEITVDGIPYTATNGVYNTGRVLYEGEYTVSYTSAVPNEYRMTNPITASPPSFIVSVGRSCTTNGATGASCASAGFSFSASNIQDLNFGMTNNSPWFQCIGASCRIEGGFTNPIPSSAGQTCSISTPGPYASIAGPNTTTPGIMYSGDGSFDFGSGGGQASPSNWQVGGNTTQYSEEFAQQISRTSYSYMTTTLRQSDISATELTTINGCGGSNNGSLDDCTLPVNLPSGIYHADGDLHLNSYTFGASKSVIILVKNNLYIDGEITVPTGSSATFSVAGDIIIDRSIGETDVCSQACNVDGFFSADGSFVIDGFNSCTNYATDLTTRDKRFNLCGALVTNAGGTGGSVQNERDLCDNDRIAPSFSVIFRPDFLLNPPEFIKYKSDVWKEIAP